MSMDQDRTDARRQAGRRRARFAKAAPLAGTALGAIAATALAGEAAGWVAVLGGAAVLAAALFWPQPSRQRPDAPASAEETEAEDAPSAPTLAELADAVPEPIVLINGAGIVIQVNKAAAEAFGALPPGLMLRIRFRAPEMQGMIDALISRGEAQAIDYAERVPFERAYRVSAMRVGEGRRLFALVFRDQSEARRIDRMRADFIANASHELRTPLASISGFIETLRGPAKNDAKARETFLGIMQRQTERMARLIDDLLSLSRLEMRTYVRPTTPVDLVAIVSQIAEALGQLARDADVVFEISLPQGPVEVPGNRDELIQVFQNLIENAIKYGGEGGKVEISMADRRASAENEVAVTIRDHGPGIAEEHIPRITERFYRVDVETSRATKGTGLGLAIVKHIVTRHDARLTIKSELGQGAAFTVHMPGTVH
jgi:two-component system phosphate regulon sensor histidine kinase PhoR